MRYLSVCSGIEAATAAWHPLGWKPLAFSEIEPFPRAVLAHHYPDVPVHGDFTVLRDQPWIADADVLVGGTPCQAFSVAGLRGSLSDDRGNLTLEFVRLADAIDDLRHAAGRDPAIIIWENVPGVLSVKDNAFGCFLAALVGNDAPLVATGGKWTNAGLVVGPKRAAAWRILDAQYFGVAQRRRRVFVVSSARDGFDPAAVLFESEGMRRDTPPSREAGQSIANALTDRADRGGTNSEGQRLIACGGLNFSGQSLTVYGNDGVAPTLDTGAEHHNRGIHVTHSLRGEGFDASEDGTGRGTPIVPVEVCPTLRAGGNRTGGDRPPGTDVDTADSLIPVAYSIMPSDLAPTLTSNYGKQPDNSNSSAGPMLVPVAFRWQNETTGIVPDDCAASLKAKGTTTDERSVGAYVAFHPTQDPIFSTDGTTHANGGGQVAVAVAIGADCYNGDLTGDVAMTLKAAGGEGNPAINLPTLVANMAVRRLTPRECERLQGFPDDYTLIPWRGKEAPDGPRYKALGNSMAVPVMRWIGQRIGAVDDVAA